MKLLQTFSLVFVQDTTNVKAKKDTWGAFNMRYTDTLWCLHNLKCPSVNMRNKTDRPISTCVQDYNNKPISITQLRIKAHTHR